MPTGLQRVRAALAGREPDTVPICPILHIMGTRLVGVPIRHYTTDAAIMAESVLTSEEMKEVVSSRLLQSVDLLAANLDEAVAATGIPKGH